jgi:hypothetical protein
MAATVSKAKAAPEISTRRELFCRLWGIALAAHVIGNWAQPDVPSLVGIANLVVGALGVFLVFRPNHRLLLTAAIGTIVSLLAEMPFTGNHWLLAGLVSLAALLTQARSRYFFPAARWLLMVFYVFAGFAKLNSGFFDPSVSCAVFFANQSLTSLRLPTLDRAWAWLPIWGSVVVELAVPVLLAIRRLRYPGVLIATAFHVLISFDLGQHFYDFTAVLAPLFFLFLSDESVARIGGRLHMLRPNPILAWALGAVTLALVGLAVLPSTLFSLQILKVIPFVLWVPAAATWLYVLLAARSPGEVLSWNPGLASAVIALAVINGLTPYTETKTAYGFNMYANLKTAGGQSNHFVVSRTFPLRDGYEAPVEIVSSSDPGLELYRDLEYLIAFPQLRRYLSAHPGVSITYDRDGMRTTVERAGDNPQFRNPVPWWWRFMPLRALDVRSPPRCQDVFLPAQ